MITLEQFPDAPADDLPRRTDTPARWVAKMIGLWRDVEAARTADEQSLMLQLWRGMYRTSCPEPYTETREKLKATLEALEK